MKLGVISDTHNFLDPKIPELFAGVEHIVHAGDVGAAWITFQLGQIAPVTAVSGNTDTFSVLKETEVIELGGRKILVQHIVEPRRLSDGLQERIQRERPDILVFGHTHRRYCERVDGVLFFNPGYAGRQRFDLQRSAAILEWTDGEIRTSFVEL